MNLIILLALALDPTATVSRPPPPDNQLFVETDPATFAFKGFAAHLRVRPAALPHWSLGLGVYAMDMPAVYPALSPENRGEGWSLRVRLGTSAFMDYYLRPSADGLFLGAQAGVQQLAASRAGGEARFTTLLLMPRVGYLWRPFDNGFYLMPWLGVGYTERVVGSPRVGGDDYGVFPLIAFATLHVGWRF